MMFILANSIPDSERDVGELLRHVPTRASWIHQWARCLPERCEFDNVVGLRSEHRECSSRPRTVIENVSPTATYPT